MSDLIPVLGGKPWEVIPNAEKTIAEQAARIKELESDRDALKVDAWRYRWIAHQTAGERLPSGVKCFVFPAITPVGNIMQGSVSQHLGEAIDAAIKEQQ